LSGAAIQQDFCGQQTEINVAWTILAHAEVVSQLLPAKSEKKYENFTKHPTSWRKFNRKHY
jgi:hypothetical protein